ncbi:MAG: PQQ-binding-like beta-propeller repeat protein [Planctomycetota bacterium]|jgi:outer membrane protein assembly factor BamB
MSRLILTLFLFIIAFISKPATAEDWSHFRGPDGSGATSAKGLALTWGDGKNIRWQAKLPGRGASSVIIVGKRAFITCYSGYGLNSREPGKQGDLKLHVLCYDAESGKPLWDQSFSSAATVRDYRGFVALHGYASSTPASDGKAVYAYFGANGLVAYDLDGKLLWRKKLGSKTHSFGTANSPVLHEGLVIVNAAVESGRIVGLDKKTGKIAWEAGGIERSWNTPSLVKASSGRVEVIVNTKGKLRAYDPKTGDKLWTCSAINDYICPSVISHDGTVYAIGGRSATAVAVRAGGKGEVEPLWKTSAGSNVSSPVYYKGNLYWVSDKGIAHCLDAKTGKIVYQERLKNTGRVYASVLLAEDRLYAVSREKGTWVLAAQPEFKQLAHNVFESDGSVFNGSPAILGGAIYLRSDEKLYCIGKGDKKTRL